MYIFIIQNKIFAYCTKRKIVFGVKQQKKHPIPFEVRVLLPYLEKIDYYQRADSENKAAYAAHGQLFLEENCRRYRCDYRCTAVVYRKHNCRGNIASRNRCKLIDGKQND